MVKSYLKEMEDEHEKLGEEMKKNPPPAPVEITPEALRKAGAKWENIMLPKRIRHKQETLAQGEDFKRWRHWACYEGPDAVKLRKPAKCPKCGDPDNIGQLDGIESDNDQDYETQGGRYYCVSCGWTEPKIILNTKKPLNLVCRIRKRYLVMIDKGLKDIEYRPDTPFWRTRIRNLLTPPVQGSNIVWKGFLVDTNEPVKLYDKDFKAPVQIVLVSGKMVRRRQVTYIERIVAPDYFSEQGKKDVSTPFCWAIKLGAPVSAR